MPLHTHTYSATLHAPLFYASREGNAVETDPHLAATALVHAIGYQYFTLRKDYVLQGEDATTPSYDHVTDLPFFVSDMTALDVDANERTFRTTSYTGELNITSAKAGVADTVPATDNTKGIPSVRGKSETGWHEQREYLGLAPGSTFEFTVWSRIPLPDTLGFRMGIKRSGEFRARRTDDPTSDPDLNNLLLKEAYGLETAELSDILAHSDQFVRGNARQLYRFKNVDRDYATSEVIPDLLPARDETDIEPLFQPGETA